jgi:hypothetical protein
MRGQGPGLIFQMQIDDDGRSSYTGEGSRASTKSTCRTVRGLGIEHLREPLRLSPRWFQKNGERHKCRMGFWICYYGLELETFIAKS